MCDFHSIDGKCTAWGNRRILAMQSGGGNYAKYNGEKNPRRTRVKYVCDRGTREKI